MAAKPAAPRKPGRRPKLSKQRQEGIANALRAGATIEDACELAGIAESTYHRWVQLGEAGEPQFSEFSEAATRARERKGQGNCPPGRGDA